MEENNNLNSNIQTIDEPATVNPVQKTVQTPEPKKKSNALIIVLAIMAVLLLGVSGYIVYDKVLNKSEDKETNTTENDKKNENTEATLFDTLVAAYKDYYKTTEYFKEGAIKEWNITEVTYTGYYEDQPNKKYYVMNGTYKCEDGVYSCIYQAQIVEDGDVNKFYDEFTYEDGKIESIGLFIPFVKEGIPEETDHFVLIDKSVKEQELVESEFNKLSREFRNYYAGRLVSEEDPTFYSYRPQSVEYWKFNKIVYLGYQKSNPNKKYYSLDESHQCKAGVYSCIGQEQLANEGDVVQGQHIFTYENGKIELSDMSIINALSDFTTVNEEVK